MKKSTYLCGFAAAMLLASCSNANDPIEAAQDGTVTTSEELARIELGASAPVTTVQTRAVTSKDAWASDGSDAIGVFAMANGATWDFSKTDDNNFVLNNVKGTVAGTTHADGSANNYAVSFETTQYYPRSSDYKYSFYAYYPYEAGTAAVTSDELTFAGTFNGTQDVMAGIAYDAANNGYNAAWARSNKDVHPNVAFNHMTTSLRFKVKAGTGVNIAASTDCQIKSLSMDVPTTYTLKLGKSTNAISASGYQTGYPSIEFGSTTGACPDITPASGNYFPDADTSVGDIMVPSGQTSYVLKVTYADGTTQNLNVKLANDATFLIANRYTVTLTVWGKQQISIDATLTPWTDNAETIGVDA